MPTPWRVTWSRSKRADDLSCRTRFRPSQVSNGHRAQSWSHWRGSDDLLGRVGSTLAMVTAWDELKTRLMELEDGDCLLSWPNPLGECGKPPYLVHLQPWAVDVAEGLHTLLGDAVNLRVGVMTYPDRHIVPSSVAPPLSTLLDPTMMTAALEGPSEVATGRTLVTALRFHNHTDEEVAIHTQEEWTDTRLVDPDTGDIVGGYTGYIPRPLNISPLQVFPLSPHGSALIPLTVGTASTVPELGYAVPPGEWSLVAYLWVGDDYRRTPPIPITIT